MVDPTCPGEVGQVWAIDEHCYNNRLDEIAAEVAAVTTNGPTLDRVSKRRRIGEPHGGSSNAAFQLHRLCTRFGDVSSAPPADMLVEIDELLRGPGKLVSTSG